MNSHDILIILLILTIVVIQVLVFLSIFRRIKLFREIFPDAHSFRTIKVRVPADRVADITPEEILGNLSKFSGQADVIDHHVAQLMEETGQEYIEDMFDDDGHHGDWDEDNKDDAWMRQGNEEVKVPAALIKDYLEEGWNFISPKTNRN